MVRIPRSSNTFDAHHLKSHPLGELCKLVYGKNLPTSQLRESGFPVFGANGVIGWNNTYLYKSPMVVISCRGEYSGTVNMTPAKSFVTNNSIICEVIDPTIVFKRFLYWFLSIIPRSSVISGSAQPQVIVQDLKRVNVSCPTSRTTPHRQNSRHYRRDHSENRSADFKIQSRETGPAA